MVLEQQDIGHCCLTSVYVGWVEICIQSHCWYWFCMDLISKEKATFLFLQSLKFSGRLFKSTADIIRVLQSRKTHHNMASEIYIFPTLSLAPLWLFYNLCPLTWKESFWQSQLDKTAGVFLENVDQSNCYISDSSCKVSVARVELNP